MDPKFLDEVIVTLAKGGPDQRWLASMAGDPAEPIDREDRDAWAKRVAEDALALASARERVLLATQAVDADFGQDGAGAPPPRADAMTVKQEAEKLEDEYTRDPDSTRKAAWLRVARLARTFRAPAVSEATVEAIARDVLAPFHGSDPLEPEWLAEATAKIRKRVSTDGASVVVDREGYYALKKAEQERDSLAAKLAEAEKELADQRRTGCSISDLRLSLDREAVLRAKLATAEREASTVTALWRDLNAAWTAMDTVLVECGMDKKKQPAQACEWVRGRLLAGQSAERERDEARKWPLTELHAFSILRKHLRPCPPASVLYTVDVDAVVKQAQEFLGLDDHAALALRGMLVGCARAADVEGLAKAMQSAALIHSGLGAPSGDCLPSPDRIEDARAALAHLGLALAQEPRDVLDEWIDQLRDAVRDAVESVERTPAQHCGTSMLHTVQIGSKQVELWRAALVAPQLEAREKRKEGA